jgi:hypothetical protein
LVDQAAHVGFEFLEGFEGVAGVEVVNEPEGHAGKERREEGLDEMAVLGFLESDDQIRGFEVSGGGLAGEAQRIGQRDVTHFEAGFGEGGEGAVIDDAVGLDAQATGVGDPGEAALGREVVEEDFGEARAVVVAGAEEEEAVRLLAHGRDQTGRGCHSPKGVPGRGT